MAFDANEESIQRYVRAYFLQLIGGFLFSEKSSDKVHLMFFPLLQGFEAIGRYNWGSTCLVSLYRQLCRASHIDTHDISKPLILLQIWIWDRFPYIAPNRLHITPYDDQLPTAPLAIRYICRITINVTIMIQLKVMFYVFFYDPIQNYIGSFYVFFYLYRWKDEYQTTSSSMHVLSQYRYQLDRLTLD